MPETNKLSGLLKQEIELEDILYKSGKTGLGQLLSQKVSLADILLTGSEPVEPTFNIDKNLKVVHLTSFPFGGAGIAAYRIHKGMLEQGINSTMLVLQKRSDEPGVKVLPTEFISDVPTELQFDNLDNLSKLHLRWHYLYEKNPNRPEGLEMFSDTFSIGDLADVKEIEEADVINLHWVSGLLNYDSLRILGKDKLIFWTLHDMNAFTGGCHYSGDCLKYRIECGMCPQLGSEVFADASNHIWHKKLNAYKDVSIQVITPSKWLAKCASDSALFSKSKFKVDVIHYGLPLDIFKPYNKAELRNEFKIPEGKKVLLFGSDAVLNPRKGFKYMLESLKKIESKNVVLSIFGNLPEDWKIEGDFTVLKHGKINDQQKLAKIYSMADGFIIPTTEDNLPNTAIESLACGTPVVTFDTGGLPDIAEHKKTGFLAELRNTDSLAEGINWVLNLENPEEVSEQCRKKAIRDFEMKKQTGKYLEKYTRDHSILVKEKVKEKDLQQLSHIIPELKDLLKYKRHEVISWAIKGLLAKFPDYPELLELQAEVEFLRGNKVEASKFYKNLVTLFPYNSNVFEKAAVVLWETGKVFEALKYFQKVLIKNPGLVSSIINFAESFSALGLFEQMKNLYFSYLAIHPKDNTVRNLYLDKIVSYVKENLEKRESENEDKYLVSAIVSVYNAERFIKGLVHDLESQTIASQVEIIMVNSNSPQNEDKLIREYLEKYPNIKYIRTKERETVYQAWNRAIKLASGKYITNANTDDRHREDAFAVMVDEFEAYPEVSLVYADIKVTENENEDFFHHSEYSAPYVWFDWDREILLRKGCFMGPQPMWRKELHDEYGFFDGSSVTSGDYEFWLRASQTNNFKRIPSYLGLYLKSPESVEHLNKDKQAVENRKYLKEYHDADAKGEIIKRLKKLPELSFETAVVPENVLPADTSGFRDMDFFIDYKWNPNANIGKNGYYILAHKWEAYSLPASWIEPLNKKPDEIWVPSAFVRDSYINSGIIEDKVKIIPTGIDIKKFSPEVKPWKINTKKGFKFLFVGSLTERKGIDILLSAFGEEFSDEEDVCLVVRDDMTDVTERNEEIREKINSLNSVIYYGEELEDLPGLYTGADCFVYPFKAEGFGIHVLEAMSSQLPVIVTNGGGPLDYCNHGNSYLLNAEWVDTEDNMNEMHELVDNVYRFEPDKEHLKKLMRQVIKDKREADDKAKKARKTVVKNYSWEAVLEKVNNTLASLKRKPVLRFNLDKIKPDLLKQGLEYFKKQNYSEAEKNFAKLSRFENSNSDYFYNLGLCQFMQKKYDDAVNSFASSLELGMATYDVCNFLAQSLEKSGDSETADLYYSKAEELKAGT